MDQDEDKKFVINASMSFTRDELINLATIGFQASVLAGIQAQKDDVEIADTVYEDEEDESSCSDTEEQEETVAGLFDTQTIALSMKELESLMEIAKKHSNPNTTRNHVWLESKYIKEEGIVRLYVKDRNENTKVDISDTEYWLKLKS